MAKQDKIINILYQLVAAAACLAIDWNEDNVKKCSDERTISPNGTYIWRQKFFDMDYVVSQPDVCRLNNSIVVRQCVINNSMLWKPDVERCEKVKKKNAKCPEDLTELFIAGKLICLKVSQKPQMFNENYCYGSSYILKPDDNVLIRILFRKQIDRIWLPVKRVGERHFSPYVIRLPGISWNKLYDVLTFAQHMKSLNKQCIGAYIVLVTHEPQIEILPTDCNNKLYSVCFFKREELVSKNGCPQNFGAISYRPNECYGLTWEGHKFPQDMRMVDVYEYYEKSNTFKIILSDHKIPIDDDVEVKSPMKIPNGKWAINIKKDILSIVPFDYRIRSLCLEQVPIRKDVELVLRLDNEDDILVLTVYNKFYIWTLNNKEDFIIHCFAVGDYGEHWNVKLKQIWENELQTKTMYELEIKSNSPSQYWCEAHTIFNFSMVKSQKIIAAKKKSGHNFALQLDFHVKRTINMTESLSKCMKAINKDLERTLKFEKSNDSKLDNFIIHSVRIIDILEYDFPRIRCLCHISVSVKSPLIIHFSDTSHSLEDEDGDKSHTETYSVILSRNLLVQLIQHLQPNMIHTIRSTELCFPDNYWPRAVLGRRVTPSILCLQSNGLPLTRKCVGSFIEGAYWDENLTQNNTCLANERSGAITENLYNMDIMQIPKNDPETSVRTIRTILENNFKLLIPADLHYLAKLMRKSLKNIVRRKIQPCDTLERSPTNFTHSLKPLNISEIVLEIDRIYNYLMKVDKKVLHSSLVLNSTNILLDAFEYTMDQISLNILQHCDINTLNHVNKLKTDSDQEIYIKHHKDIGVFIKAAPHFVIFAINPTIANVTGVAIFKSDSDSDTKLNSNMLGGAFSNQHYKMIYANQSVNNLLNEDSIVLGTFIPETLWNRLDEISSLSKKNNSLPVTRPEPLVIIKIYSNDKLFQEDDDEMVNSVMGNIISISIPGHDKDLPELLPLILTDIDNESDDETQYCSYWNYKSWARDGVTLIQHAEHNNNTILCGCTHLTPFAYLIRGSYDLYVESEVEVVVTKIHENALNIITLLGCSLSIFGVIGIFVTACAFRTWRQKANSKVLLQLSVAIALQMILFCFVNTTEYAHHLIVNKIFPSCIAIGALLHYSVLVQFCWMIIIAYLQFKRYVQVFGNTRPQRFFIKSTLLGWGLPTIPVGFVLIFDRTSYIPHANNFHNPICYPSGRSLYVGIIAPISIVILANLVIFAVVTINIMKSPAGSMRHTEKSFALSQLRLLVLLFFLLGFTWIFGLLTVMDAGLVFSYLFCLTATLQGFILFIYFILMDPNTRRLWCGNFRRWFKYSTNNTGSMKDTTQSF
ncbi:uncharacterized protein LOC142221347 [Haematobia irritans]|uniref:uncharacterized protein LOC142221347 n=1 Tax=Haematobia irritans TaxID=7368 RepID=UPI003F5001E8